MFLLVFISGLPFLSLAKFDMALDWGFGFHINTFKKKVIGRKWKTVYNTERERSLKKFALIS